MSLWHLVFRELRFRAGHSLMAVGAVVVAVGTVTGARSLLQYHEGQELALLNEREIQTRTRMESLKQTVRQAMDRLGFNVMILPQGQDLGDWYSQDYASGALPADAAQKLRTARLTTLEKPVAQLRQKIKWPENQWTVILVGTEGRILKSSTSGDVEALKPGTVWLGQEVHRGLGLKEGAALKIMGKDFRVERCLDAEGSNEDITIWMPLAEAQELLGKQGQVNEIAAVETMQVRGDLAAVRREVAAVLPGAQVVEQASKRVTKLQVRLSTATQAREALEQERQAQVRLATERNRLAWTLNGLVLLICAAWVGLLAFSNAGERSGEIGTWQALGLGFSRVTFLFGAKWCILAFVGCAAGFAGGVVAAVAVGVPEDGAAQLRIIAAGLGDGPTWGLAMAVALGLALLGSWIPVAFLARQDPAVVLQEE